MTNTKCYFNIASYPQTHALESKLCLYWLSCSSKAFMKKKSLNATYQYLEEWSTDLGE